MDEVRPFYKDGAKSSNKAYYLTGRPSEPKLEPNVKLTAAQANRNQQTEQNIRDATHANRDFKASAGKTPYSLGQQLYNQGNTRGNCGEMAAVAMYRACYPPCSLSVDEIWMLTLISQELAPLRFSKIQFGHTVAVLGRENEASDARWVVDPWANICCTMSKYSETIMKKLTQWQTQGKRIAAQTQTGLCWVQPLHGMVVGIVGRKVHFDWLRVDKIG